MVMPLRNRWICVTICIVFFGFTHVRQTLGQDTYRSEKVTMSSQFLDWVGSRAFDGNHAMNADGCQCCAATQRETNPWVKVDLGTTYPIKHIIVYGRNDGDSNDQNLNNLELYLDDELVDNATTRGAYINYYHFDLSNSSFTARYIKFVLPVNGKVLTMCEVDIYKESYKGMDVYIGNDLVKTLPYTGWDNFYDLDLRPPVNGQNITLELSGYKQMVVCELLVVGECLDYYFGPNCSTQCHCEGAPCDKHTGVCPSGTCTPGYIGKTCSQGCPESLFGHNCLAKCHCEGPACNITTGICPSGECMPGFKGQTCSKVCDEGRYGQNCSEWCGHCFEDHLCDDITGNCGICDVGYTFADPQCKTACPAYTFGSDCIGHCHCEGQPCDAVTAICPSGECRPGYTGDTCSQECESGWYGEMCSVPCGHCLDVCDHLTGHCVSHACKPGYTYTDRLCKTECEDGRYGNNCSEVCGHCLNGTPCNHATGRCAQCDTGYNTTDPFCNTECTNGTCNKPNHCGNCRSKEACIDGYCTECMDGYSYLDKTCLTPCTNGHYGRNCTNTCGQCRNDESCDAVDGHCMECMDGFTALDINCKTSCPDFTFGMNCSERCGDCRNNVTCHSIDGHCEMCEDGYIYNATYRLCKTECQNGTFGFNCQQRINACNTTHCADGCITGTEDTCISEEASTKSDVVTPAVAGSISGVVLLVLICVIIVKRRYRQATTGQSANLVG